jgi:hypothetical protein
VFVVDGCDTLAYVDRTLAERRAVLNPDDRSGTKYMDTVTNVLGAWFRVGDETAVRFVRRITEAVGPNAAPKTYRQLFAGVDREQHIVVTGEEDNEFPVTPEPVVLRSPPEALQTGETAGDLAKPEARRSTVGGGSGCSFAWGASDARGMAFFMAAAALALRRSRSRYRRYRS